MSDENCRGHQLPRALSEEEYNARSIPRLSAIDSLAARINFDTCGWQLTPEGKRYLKLMDEQAADEFAAGL